MESDAPLPCIILAGGKAAAAEVAAEATAKSRIALTASERVDWMGGHPDLLAKQQISALEIYGKLCEATNDFEALIASLRDCASASRRAGQSGKCKADETLWKDAQQRFLVGTVQMLHRIEQPNKELRKDLWRLLDSEYFTLDRKQLEECGLRGQVEQALCRLMEVEDIEDALNICRDEFKSNKKTKDNKGAAPLAPTRTPSRRRSSTPRRSNEQTGEVLDDGGVEGEIEHDPPALSSVGEQQSKPSSAELTKLRDCLTPGAHDISPSPLNEAKDPSGESEAMESKTSSTPANVPPSTLNAVLSPPSNDMLPPSPSMEAKSEVPTPTVSIANQMSPSSRPCGRPPQGKVWDESTGAYMVASSVTSEDESAVCRDSASRPQLSQEPSVNSSMDLDVPIDGAGTKAEGAIN